MPNSAFDQSSYRPARGGHAPGDLRNAFLEAIEAYGAWIPKGPEPTVEVQDRPIGLAALCGLLWNCSDIMPGSEQQQLEDALPQRCFGEDRAGSLSTYARAARAMSAAIKGDNFCLQK